MKYCIHERVFVSASGVMSADVGGSCVYDLSFLQVLLLWTAVPLVKWV